MHERKVGTLAACFIGYRYSIISSHRWFAGRATKHLQRSGLLWVFLVWDFSRWEDALICRVQTGIKLNNWKQTTEKTLCFWNIWECCYSPPLSPWESRDWLRLIGPRAALNSLRSASNFAQLFTAQKASLWSDISGVQATSVPSCPEPHGGGCRTANWSASCYNTCTGTITYMGMVFLFW